MRFVNVTAIPNGEELTVLRIGTTSASNQPLFLDVRLTKVSGSQWRLSFYNEATFIDFAGGANMASHDRWWYISVGNNNADLSQSMRVAAWNTLDQIVPLISSEQW
jgi:hypothetical protein